MENNNSGILLWLLLVEFCLLCDTQRFLNTGLYQRVHTDGPGGKCKLSPYIKSGIPLSNSEVRCESGWIKNQTHSTSKLTIPNKRRCKYFKRRVTYFCYDTPQGRNGSATCIRNTIFYHILNTCSEYWLNWEKCDKNCGGGTRARVRITKSKDNIYRINTDYRPCNVHPCPRWTEWEPNNVNESCDPKTCTRVWKRHCVFNNTVAHPSFCGDEKVVRRNIFNESNANSTYEIRSCFLHECVTPTSTAETTLPTGNSLTSAVVPDTTGPLFQENIQDVEITRTPNDRIWLGIGIGFSVALCVFLLGCYIAYNSRKRIKSYLGKKRSQVSEPEGEYTRDNAPALITPLGSIEDVAHLPSSESVYCTVPSQPTALNLGQNDSEQQYSIVGLVNNPPNIEETDQSAHIENITQNGESAVYSTSEFDSCSDNDLDVDGNSNVLAYGNKAKEEGCMSFDSDEDRDVVHTLRKSKDKVRMKRLGSKDEADDVFSSEEEELTHGDHDNERSSASVAHYSKLKAKRLNQCSHATAHDTTANKGTELGFQCVSGRSHTSETSEISLCAQEGIPEEKPLAEHAAGGHQKLSSRHSSGASSIVSCNIDAVTSGYNSAHSTDDDHFVWNNKARLRSRRSTLTATFSYQKRRQAQQQWKLSSLRNYASREQQQHTNTTALCPRTANSLFNPKISRLPGTNREQNVNSHEQSHDAWAVMYPNVSRSSSTLPGRGCHSRRDIEMEDVYSFPADAQSSVLKENVYSHYNVPFDAIQR